MSRARIEDDDFQLKVSRDELDALRAVQARVVDVAANRVEASGPVEAARRLLGTTTTTTTTPPTAPAPMTAKQPAGLAFRALHAATKKREP